MRVIHGFAAASAAVLMLTLGAVAPATADIVCSSDECDAGAWKAARGEFNDQSFWGMDPGHNCTNYVAWKLTLAGVQRPFTNPGNASTWAARAAADGYLVDHTPAVGAVAQWDSFAGGNGIDGHVAYVEEVYADGTILVSEDYWHGGDQTGPLTFRTLPASEVSNFIHYIDTSDWLRQALSTSGSWVNRTTGLDPNPTVISAVSIGDDLRVYFAENGALEVATQSDAGWQIADTGVDTVGRSLVAVDMGREWPYLMSIENGQLVMMVQTDGGWQLMGTGLAVTGEIAAIDLGGLWPTAYVSQDGVLYELWWDMQGWHMRSTDIEVWGAITAVTNAAGWPEVYSIESGTIFRSWADAAGWHKEGTGVTAEGTLSATLVNGTVSLALLQDGELYQVARDAAGVWAKQSTGLRGGRLLTVIDGGDAPLVIQVG